MKLYKKFSPSVKEYLNINTNYAKNEFICRHNLSYCSASGPKFSFSGYTNKEYIFLYSVETLKRGFRYKKPLMRKVYITHYVIPIKLIEILQLKVTQYPRFFKIEEMK